MFLQQVDDVIQTRRPWMDNYKFHLVDTVQKLKQLVDICITKDFYALDLETTGVDNRVYKDSYFKDGKLTRHGMRTVSQVVGICLSFDGVNGYYVPVGHVVDESCNLPWDEAWDEIERLANSKAGIILHNSKFDLEFLYPLVKKDLWKIMEYDDTYLMSKILTPLKSSPNGLKQLTKLHFGVDMIELHELFSPELLKYLKMQGQSYNFGYLHPKEGLEYACSDAIFTYKLYFKLKPKLSENDSNIYNLEKSFCNVLRKLERNRVHIDTDRLRQLKVECERELANTGDLIRSCIESFTGGTGKWLSLNVGSVAQLGRALMTDPEGMKIKPTKEMEDEANNAQSFSAPKKSGDDEDDEEESEETDVEIKYSLKDEALKSLHRAYGERYKIGKHSLFETVLEYRHYQKMLGSYIEPLSKAVDRNGDVRPNFNQMGTDTARLSSRAGKIEDGYSGINFQGIPRDSDEDKPDLFKQIRTVITPREGYVLLKLDFAGEELRVVTNLSGDKIWTKSFLYEDGDVHSITARILFRKDDVNKDERNRGKRSNFAFIYGGGAGAIQRNVGCTMDEAKIHMDNLKEGVPELMNYVEHQKSYARKYKEIITAYGRRIPIDNIDSPIRSLRSKAERCAINYTIQGTSADVLKYAMCLVDKKIRENGWEDIVRYVLTVHDEVVYEVKPEYLMEVTRKLDEWMTYPWKINKVHGRDWEVPLLTEPGIDINWKARYDYFAMVDGSPAKREDIDKDGKFNGKLKKGQYFFEGRIYQEVPDFLKPYIRRLNGPQDTGLIENKPVEEIPLALPEPKPLLESPKPSPIQEPEVKPEIKIEPEIEPVAEDKSEMIKTDDLDFDDIKIESPKVEPKVETFEDVEESDYSESSEIKDDSLDEILSSDISTDSSREIETKYKEKLTKEKVIEKSENEKVLRWVLKANPSKYIARKIHAVTILAEGDMLLRVVSPKDEIIISESKGIRVNKDEFIMLCRLFGLG